MAADRVAAGGRRTDQILALEPEDTALEDLVSLLKLRWRIERDYRDLKQEIGLDHFEGRGWRGFHHHASLCITAYAFLVAERCLFPPEQRVQAKLPEPLSGWTPRGAGAAARAS